MKKKNLRFFYGILLCLYAICEYHLVDDTLYVKKFKHALVLPWHPTFIDAKLIRKKM